MRGSARGRVGGGRGGATSYNLETEREKERLRWRIKIIEVWRCVKDGIRTRYNRRLTGYTEQINVLYIKLKGHKNIPILGLFSGTKIYSIKTGQL